MWAGRCRSRDETLVENRFLGIWVGPSADDNVHRLTRNDQPFCHGLQRKQFSLDDESVLYYSLGSDLAP